MRLNPPEGSSSLLVHAGRCYRYLDVDVVAALDLSAIYASYEELDGCGQAAYAPEMMRLLLTATRRGGYSPRKIEARAYEDVTFRYLSADEHRDHDTIAAFRQRHLQALAGLFTQALLLCEKAGLVKSGHVAIDGTKIRANAIKHKAMSYDLIGGTERRLQQEIDALLRCLSAGCSAPTRGRLQPNIWMPISTSSPFDSTAATPAVGVCSSSDYCKML